MLKWFCNLFNCNTLKPAAENTSIGAIDPKTRVKPDFPQYRITRIERNNGHVSFHPEYVIDGYADTPRYRKFVQKYDGYSNIEEAQAYIDKFISYQTKSITHIPYP